MKSSEAETLKDGIAPEQAVPTQDEKYEDSLEFVPENKNADQESKKVTFADRDNSGKMIKLYPNDAVVFIESDEFIGTLTIYNVSDTAILYKIRTTSPKKFRVKPNMTTLGPGLSLKVSIVVQPAYQIRNVLRDKFLVVSIQVPTTALSAREMHDVWRESSGMKIDEFRLACRFPSKEPKLKALTFENLTPTNLEAHYNNINKLMNYLKDLQLITLTSLVFLIAILLTAVFDFYNKRGVANECNNEM